MKKVREGKHGTRSRGMSWEEWDQRWAKEDTALGKKGLLHGLQDMKPCNEPPFEAVHLLTTIGSEPDGNKCVAEPDSDIRREARMVLARHFLGPAATHFDPCGAEWNTPERTQMYCDIVLLYARIEAHTFHNDGDRKPELESMRHCLDSAWGRYRHHRCRAVVIEDLINATLNIGAADLLVTHNVVEAIPALYQRLLHDKPRLQAADLWKDPHKVQGALRPGPENVTNEEISRARYDLYSLLRECGRLFNTPDLRNAVTLLQLLALAHALTL